MAVSFLIYLFGRFLSVKSGRNGNVRSAYACGERAKFGKLKISVSNYRFLIYFVILDSSVLLAAFAALVIQMANAFFLTLYLFIVILSGLLLFEEGDH